MSIGAALPYAAEVEGVVELLPYIVYVRVADALAT